jgi:hypothetical protein
MSLVTSTQSFESIMTGEVEWAVTPRGSTEPAIESSSELVFYKKLGSIVIPKSYEVLYGRYPGDSNHGITLRAGLRPILNGVLEIKGPRSHTDYRRYVGEDESYEPTTPFTRNVGDTTWEWERTGSWLNADHNSDKILSLPAALRRFPEIQPMDPTDGGSQVLLAIARTL